MALVVDDDAGVAETVADGLEVLGYPTVETTGSVDKALDVVDSEQVEMAIVETTVRNRSTEAVLDALDEKNIPFVVMTTSTSSHVRTRPNPLLFKPFGFHLLKDAVEQARRQGAIQRWDRLS